MIVAPDHCLCFRAHEWIECTVHNRCGDDAEKGNLYSAVVGRAASFIRTTSENAKGQYAL